MYSSSLGCSLNCSWASPCRLKNLIFRHQRRWSLSELRTVHAHWIFILAVRNRNEILATLRKEEVGLITCGDCRSGKRARLITNVWVKHMRRSILMLRVMGKVLTNSVLNILSAYQPKIECRYANLR